MERHNQNYQRQLDETLERLQGEGIIPSLLLHVCCAPCSSYVLEYLSRYFDITVFFYNPNIAPQEEYQKRFEEEKRFLPAFPAARPVKLVEWNYDPERFLEMAKGREELPEGGRRCYDCYEMRLRETAAYAASNGFSYFTTTLSISPYKNARWLNEIGERLGEEYGVPYLVSDFKKKSGYQRSIELSKEYELYRQPYCGCIYSQNVRKESK